ncbi:MAG: hypothetical protein H6707_09020 [Deltaproteobacteria bacterium]|nr:hypothetical protein [Deltaproteobacteria bacterium]
MFKGIVWVVIGLGFAGLASCGGLAGEGANTGSGKAEGQEFATISEITGPNPQQYVGMLGIAIEASQDVCVWMKVVKAGSPFYRIGGPSDSVVGVGIKQPELGAGTSLLIAPSMAHAKSIRDLDDLNSKLTKSERKNSKFAVEIAIGDRAEYRSCQAFADAIYATRNPEPEPSVPVEQPQTEDCFDADGFPNAATIGRLVWDNARSSYEDNDTRLAWYVFCRHEGQSLFHKLVFHTSVVRGGDQGQLLILQPGGVYTLHRQKEPYNFKDWEKLATHEFESCKNFLSKLHEVSRSQLGGRLYRCPQ